MTVVTYNQPTAAPTAKMAAVGGTSVLVAAIIALLTAFGVTVPDGLNESATQAVQGAIYIGVFVQAVLPFLAGYFKKSEKVVK